MRRQLAIVMLAVTVAGCAARAPALIGGDRGEATSGDVEHEAVLAAPVAGTSVHCGYERWAVKTGTDPLAGQVSLVARPTIIAALAALHSPLPPVKGKYPPQTRRQPSEEQTVTVTTTLVRYALEQDGDFHLVLRDAKLSMIAEIPNPLCVAGGPFKTAITSARAAFIAKTHYNPPPPPPGQYAPAFVTADLPVTITGVRFFDFIHGQAGVAPNGVELHPVLAITFG